MDYNIYIYSESDTYYESNTVTLRATSVIDIVRRMGGGGPAAAAAAAQTTKPTPPAAEKSPAEGIFYVPKPAAPGPTLYVCSLGTGFVGTFDEVQVRRARGLACVAGVELACVAGSPLACVTRGELACVQRAFSAWASLAPLTGSRSTEIAKKTGHVEGNAVKIAHGRPWGTEIGLACASLALRPPRRRVEGRHQKTTGPGQRVENEGGAEDAAGSAPSARTAPSARVHMIG
jgi:hypothetical protein